MRKTLVSLIGLWLGVVICTRPIHAQIVVIQGNDTVSSSRITINNNFSYLNTQLGFRLIDPTTTTGDLIYRSSGGTTRLGIGTTGQCLTVAAGIPSWATSCGSGGGGITALTGDVTASGTGSVAATLATVNSTTGSFGDSTHVGTFTVNGKGLITAAANVAISGGGGGASAFYQLTDFQVVKTSGTVETINLAATTTAPVNGSVGQTSFSFTAPATATISGTTSTGAVNWCLTSSGTLSIEHNLAATITGSGLTVVNSQATCRSGDKTEYVTTMTGNVWDTVTEGMDKRNSQGFQPPDLPGLGVTITQSSNANQIAVDATVIPTLAGNNTFTATNTFSGTIACTGTCTGFSGGSAPLLFTSVLGGSYWPNGRLRDSGSGTGAGGAGYANIAHKVYCAAFSPTPMHTNHFLYLPFNAGGDVGNIAWGIMNAAGTFIAQAHTVGASTGNGQIIAWGTGVTIGTNSAENTYYLCGSTDNTASSYFTIDTNATAAFELQAIGAQNTGLVCTNVSTTVGSVTTLPSTCGTPTYEVHYDLLFALLP